MACGSPTAPPATYNHPYTFLHVKIYIFKMPREEGKEWNHVKVIELKLKDKRTSTRWSASTASMSL